MGIATGKRATSTTGVADFSEAIRLKPKFSMARFGRGCTYWSMGQTDKAIADFTEAVHLREKRVVGQFRGRRTELLTKRVIRYCVPRTRQFPPEGLKIMGNPTVVTEPTTLQSLLTPNQGNVWWSACQAAR